MRRIAPCAALAATLVLAPRAAAAFCGFYVDGSGDKLVNNASQVVLMRDGTRTVLSMENNYQGPPEAFAMVVPVPVVLQKADVRTLDRAVFDRVEAMDAPRLVEYWEQDPCRVPPEPRRRMLGAALRGHDEDKPSDDLGVKVEAQFAVGEYDVVVLSASDSTGLATWLERAHYAIPSGAAPFLRPYVDGGWKFFVAKVDPTKVTFANGMATLSPLRVHYDSDDFTLPIRLGLVNSPGTQDLIVHVLSSGGRVELANRPNATVPTNLDVRDEVRTRFAEFYAGVFDATVAAHPHAVVTEYAWDARSCDPCPVPPLGPAELATLGADVVTPSASFTLTRLHVRYGKEEMPDDLVFRDAKPIGGGREAPGADGRLAQDAQPAAVNTFQARYVIRHPWDGPIACTDPQRGRWGGPPGGEVAAVQPARDLAFAPRGKAKLAERVAADVPALSLRAAGAAPQPAPIATAPRPPDLPPPPPQVSHGCGCGATGPGGADAGGAFLFLLVAARLRRLNPRSDS